MRLYITVWDGDRPNFDYKFTGTQADQRRLEKELKGQGIGIERSDEVEVPTDKAGLIAFLNEFKTLPQVDEGES